MEPIRRNRCFPVGLVVREPLQRSGSSKEETGTAGDGRIRCRALDNVKNLEAALGPLAEWIAQRSGRYFQLSRTKAPATRLTQNRKREAKEFQLTLWPIHRFRPGIATMQSFNVTSLRDDKFDPVAQSRRAESQATTGRRIRLGATTNQIARQESLSRQKSFLN